MEHELDEMLDAMLAEDLERAGVISDEPIDTRMVASGFIWQEDLMVPSEAMGAISL